MRTNPISLNPFSLMMEPEVVLKAMERSKTLRGLQRHQLRPLDKPLIPFVTHNGAELCAGTTDPDTEIDD
jgi:hypothetical protein